MAARKLQGEIEKTFKKVDEGNELFDETWDKVYSAETPALREKFEAELKKEIKKLQRQRDKIKNWIAGNEVKDKKQLIEYRKNIETRMEKFKQCERESKMKAYSKEGLSKSTAEAKKRAAKGTESPLKKEIREWLEQAIQSIQEQLDEAEEELKTLQKSRKPDKSQLDQLEDRVECHKKYLKCLNELTELHEDDNVTPEEVQENVQESVDFYISDNQNPDFVEDESVVDWIKEKQEEAEAAAAAAAEEEEEDEDEDVEDESDGSEDEKPEKKPVEKKPEPKKEVEPPKQPEKVVPVETKPVQPPAKKVETPAPKVEEKPQPAKQPVQQDQKNQKQATTANQQKVTKAKIEAQGLKKLTVPPVAQPPAPAPSFSNLVNNLSNQKAQQEKVLTPKSAPAQPAPKSQPPTPTVTTPVSATPQPTIVAPTAAAAQNKKKQQPAPQPTVKQPAPAPQKPAPVQTQPAQPTKPLSYSDAIAKGTGAQTPVTPQPAVQPPVQQQPPQVVPVQQQPLPPVQQPPMHILPEEADFVDSLGQDNMTLPHQLQSITSMVSGLQLGQEGLDDDKNDDTFGSSMVTGAIGSLEDLSSQTHIVHQELTPYQQQQSTVNHYQSRMLELSLKNVPHLNDTDKPKQYIAQNPYPQAPDIFPTEPSSLFNDPTIISKMDLDTLFFIFYFQQGTYQQYLAAKELKKQAWRFHKKYLTWFQRHDLPKHTTNDYELGTYVYFDYETGWCQRIKSGFRFEYEYLEDENF